MKALPKLGAGLLALTVSLAAGCRDHNETIVVDAASDPRPDVTSAGGAGGGAGGGGGAAGKSGVDAGAGGGGGT